MKFASSPKKWLYIPAVILLIVVVAVGLVSCNDKDAPAKQTVNRKTVPAKPKDVSSSGWTAVTVADGSVYFGKLATIDHPGVLYLDNAYFVTEGSSVADANTLRRFGTEVHRPISAIEFPRTSVLFTQSLVATSPAVAAIRKYEKDSPTKPTSPSSVISGRPYAVFLKDGQVFFGTLRLGDDSLTLDRTHYLSFKDEEAAQLGEIASLDDVTLVPQSQTVVAPTGVMEIPLTSVLYFQALAKDSPVAKALQKR